jgi:hypothetical protein
MFLLVTFDLEQFNAIELKRLTSTVIISSDLVVLFDLAQSNFGFT